MLIISTNGSKWIGEQPDTLAKLLEVLATETLDPSFEDYGNFAIYPLKGAVSIGRGKYAETDLIYPDAPHTIRFWGNFYTVSHVFSIDTDEPAAIATLTKAIRENQARPEYVAARAESLRKVAA